MSRTFKIAIAAFALSLTVAPAALAQTGVEQVSVRVAYGDLDTSKPAGGAELLKRIEGAAREVCGEAMPRTLLKMHSPGACRTQTVENTVRDLAIGTLTMAWSGKQPVTAVAAR
jgi:UrcA family protein